MKSFGLWYKKKEGEVIPRNTPCLESTKVEQQNNTNIPVHEPRISLHVNLWFLGDIQANNNKGSFLDIGFKIENYSQIEKLTFHCPFRLERENIESLISVKKQVNLKNLY